MFRNLTTVDATREDPRIFLDLAIGGERVQALLDSGAVDSYIGLKLIEKFHDRLRTVEAVVTGAFGTKGHVVSVVDIQVEIDNIVKKITVKAIPDITYDFMFGMDFFKIFSLRLLGEEG